MSPSPSAAGAAYPHVSSFNKFNWKPKVPAKGGPYIAPPNGEQAVEHPHHDVSSVWRELLSHDWLWKLHVPSPSVGVSDSPGRHFGYHRGFSKESKEPSNREMEKLRCSLRDFVVGSVVDLELAIQTSAQEARRLLVQTETQDAFLVVRGT